MSEKPLVSIIITTYKGDWKLVRAINSALSQTYENIEIIVVDDNGNNTEGRSKTEKLMHRFEKNAVVIYIKHEINMNGASARNSGVRAAHGEYVAFLDDDDIYRRDRIECSINAVINSGKSNAGVYVGVVSIVGKNCISKCIPKIEGRIHEELLINQGLFGSGSNIFIPKWIVEQCDGFDTAFSRFQDVEFMVRASEFLYMIPLEEIMIIKDNTNVRFLSDYQGLKEATQYFLYKFSSEINKIDRRQEAVFNKYLFLFFYACKCRNKNDIKESIGLIKSYIPERKIWTRLRFKGLLLKYNHLFIYRFYKRVSTERKDVKIRNDLNMKEAKFINSFTS